MTAKKVIKELEVIKELDRKALVYNEMVRTAAESETLWWYWYGKLIATREAIDLVMR